MKYTSPASFADTKPHYKTLDGLRGIAALAVVWYHLFEGFATSPIDQRFNHGYLAVDFFFILSGFVIGYAYDDRWKKMTTGRFFQRRLIRLHPMVIFGAIFGVFTFCLQGCVQWDGTYVTPLSIVAAFLLNLLLIPAIPGCSMEVRGNGEMYPLNGPSWSLFFEYIGNILYALFLHRSSTRTLSLLTAISGIALAGYAIGNLSGFGHIGVGWTLADLNFPGGLLRMFFSYSMGLLLSRIHRPISFKGAFPTCSILLIALLSVPHLGGQDNLWINGLYDSFCVLIAFPILVYAGASDRSSTPYLSQINNFLGNLSYPLYMIHYPLMYLFYAWLWKNNLTFEQIWPITIILFGICVLLASIVLKCYDEPIRKWLTKKYQK